MIEPEYGSTDGKEAFVPVGFFRPPGGKPGPMAEMGTGFRRCDKVVEGFPKIRGINSGGGRWTSQMRRHVELRDPGGCAPSFDRQREST
jgi:hypothetical protein